jgi:DNA-binding PadR family transcriptional regulator
MPEFRLNSTAASLLGFLHDGPLTGWQLVGVATDRIGDFWSLTRSQVYRELAAMSAAGLVEAGPAGPRDRRPYAITAAGRDAFSAWAAGELSEETIRFPLLLMVSFGRHVPRDRLVGHLRAQRQVHRERLARYEAESAAPAAPGFEPYGRATLAFGLVYERAVLEWFDRLPELLGIDLDAAPV